MSTDSRDVGVTGALGERLILRRLAGTEQLGRLFDYTAELLSTDESLAFEDILGQTLTVAIALPDGGTRYVSGSVTRFAQTGRTGRHALYQARLCPWLWYLTRSADCRIFQNQSVPEIVQAVFREHGFSDFEDALSGAYDSREYCVQYRETDFDFVSRLLEEEGIYYFFRHDEDRHTLVLADDYSAHAAGEGYADIPYYPPGNEAARERDHVSEWLVSQEIQPELYALRDFDFEKPRANLEAKGAIERRHGAGSYEVYDYPGSYREKAAGEDYARVRVQERQAQFEQVRGSGNVRGLAAGGLFSLTGYPRDDQNREYLLTSVNFEVTSNPLESREAEAGTTFSCAFTAMDSQQPYRPPRLTPKPVVQGPQTAVVVGQKGQDIWTDRYGRVKVQFHWDREGANDENSSCWVRVSHNWAGKNWGGMFMPHIGHEVIVSFLDGDPDRPIITGRVYNADTMPPEELPAHRTKSIIRDYGDNEMVWEGKEGEQFIRFNQKCGNQFIMNGKPGDESVSLSDKFGNLLLMDPVNKMIALRSPSKTSGIVLGKSKHEFTDSDSVKVTGGSTGEVFVGNTAKMSAGSKVSASVGSKFDAFAGSTISASLAQTMEFAAGGKLSFGSLTSYSKTAESSTLDATKEVVMDAGTQAWVLGGKNDRSIVKADDDDLTLSYSSGSSGRREVDPPSWKQLWGPVAAPATTLLQLGISGIAEHAGDHVPPIKKGEYPSSWHETAAKVEAFGAGMGNAVAGALGAASAWRIAKQKQAEASARHEAIGEHSSTDARVKLYKSGAEIKAGSASVVVTKDGDVTIESAKSVSVSGKNINISADATVNVSGGVSHKNFSAKK